MAKVQQAAFLAYYGACGLLRPSLARAGVTYNQHRYWLRQDAGYRAQFHECTSEVADLLQDEALRRAHEGTNKPVFYKGEEVGMVTEYSDSLMMFLLRGLRPEVFRDRVEVSNAQQATSKLAVLLGVSDSELMAAIGGIEAQVLAAEAAGVVEPLPARAPVRVPTAVRMIPAAVRPPVESPAGVQAGTQPTGPASRPGGRRIRIADLWENTHRAPGPVSQAGVQRSEGGQG